MGGADATPALKRVAELGGGGGGSDRIQHIYIMG